MDVVAQALHVAAGASEAVAGSVVSLDFDLDLPPHRAAYAAAMAVLAAFGEAPEGVALPVPERIGAVLDVGIAAGLAPETEPDSLDRALMRTYLAAIEDLSGDAPRSARVVADTFPLVRDVLRDGANVEGVAQVQYLRWCDAQRAVRSTLA